MLVFSTKLCYLYSPTKPKKLLYHPKQKPRRGGGLRHINTCHKVPFFDEDILHCLPCVLSFYGSRLDQQSAGAGRAYFNELVLLTYSIIVPFTRYLWRASCMYCTKNVYCTIEESYASFQTKGEPFSIKLP